MGESTTLIRLSQNQPGLLLAILTGYLAACA